MRAALAAVALVVCGCLEPVDGIPCTATPNCPDGYFCARTGRCAVTPATPPHVTFDGVRAHWSDPFASSVSVNAFYALYPVELQFSATGADAEFIDIQLQGPACLNLDPQPLGEPPIIKAGESATVPAMFRYTESSCPSPATVTVTAHLQPDLTVSGSFEVNIKSAVPPPP